MLVVHHPAAAALLAALLTAPAPTVAHAADYLPTSLQTRTRAATCASCHHADTAPDTKLPVQTLPPFAGRSQAELINTMQAFHSGACSSTVMGQIARGYDGVQIVAIAGWLSCQSQEAP